MGAKKLFIFDMDGTLFDTEPISAQIWKEVAKEKGYTIPEGVLQGVIGMSYAGGKEVFLQEIGERNFKLCEKKGNSLCRCIVIAVNTNRNIVEQGGIT